MTRPAVRLPSYYLPKRTFRRALLCSKLPHNYPPRRNHRRSSESPRLDAKDFRLAFNTGLFLPQGAVKCPFASCRTNSASRECSSQAALRFSFAWQRPTTPSLSPARHSLPFASCSDTYFIASRLRSWALCPPDDHLPIHSRLPFRPLRRTAAHELPSRQHNNA